jgi:hypothetical protein
VNLVNNSMRGAAEIRGVSLASGGGFRGVFPVPSSIQTSELSLNYLKARVLGEADALVEQIDAQWGQNAGAAGTGRMRGTEDHG